MTSAGLRNFRIAMLIAQSQQTVCSLIIDALNGPRRGLIRHLSSSQISSAQVGGFLAAVSNYTLLVEGLAKVLECLSHILIHHAHTSVRSPILHRIADFERLRNQNLTVAAVHADAIVRVEVPFNPVAALLSKCRAGEPKDEKNLVELHVGFVHGRGALISGFC